MLKAVTENTLLSGYLLYKRLDQVTVFQQARTVIEKMEICRNN